MRAVQLDFADPSFPASLTDLPEPDLPGPGWARVRVSGGGICGSDLHLFRPATGPSPALADYVGFPMVLGHEVAGTVVEAGPECPVATGTRVAVDPTIPCAPRGLPPCDRCREGRASNCRNLASKVVTPGFVLGFTRGLGGGWAEQAVAHHSQLHPVPDAVPRRGETLHEPLSIALHGLLRRPPVEGPVLVVGAGIIGLAVVAALRALFPALEVVCLAKHPHQAEAARAVGAATVVAVDDGGGGDLEALAAHVGSGLSGRGADAMLVTGFPYVVEAVGTGPAVTTALRCTDTRGVMLLLGAGGIAEVDLSPVWFKELDVVGSVNHAHKAVATALDKTTGAIKVVLRP